MRLLYDRAGIIFILSIAFAPLITGMKPSGAVYIAFAFVWIASASVFLWKSYVQARPRDYQQESKRMFRKDVPFAIGSFAVGSVFWGLLAATLSKMDEGSTFSKTIHETNYEYTFGAVLYAAEQIVSGALLDILEVYRIRFTAITYDVTDYAAATLTLGMRLTGSIIVAALLVRSFRR